MKRLACLFFLAFSEFFVLGQSSSCHFMRDTGTVKTEISYSMIELRDGSVYVTGTQGNGPFGGDDIALLKFGACGNVLWIKYYGDTLANDAFYINKTSDEKLIVVGQTGTPSHGSDVFFYLLDTNGNVLMHKLYGDSLQHMAKYVEQTSDKGFIFCGYISDRYGSNDSWVVKIDSAGTIQWKLQVGGPSAEYADQVHELPDGNFLMTGDTKSFGHGGTDVEVVKCHKNGTIIWDNYYGDRLENGCQGVLLMSNGKYLSYGETNVPGSVAFDFFIQTIDTNGASLSRHTFGGPGADALFNLVETTGLEFICTGYSSSYNGSQADDDIVLFKVDTAGRMKWLKDVFSPGVDIGYKILHSVNGGYIVTGLFAKNNGNYFLMNSDTIGNTSVGIRETIDTDGILIYPNPGSGRLIIDNNENEKQFAELYDLAGKKIQSFLIEPGKNSIGIGQLSSGAYLLSIRSASGRAQVQKLFVASE